MAGPLERALQPAREVVVAPALDVVPARHADPDPISRRGGPADECFADRPRAGTAACGARRLSLVPSDRHEGRDLRAPLADHLDLPIRQGQDEVELVEPLTIKPVVGLVADPCHRHQLPRQEPHVARRVEHDHRLDRRIAWVPTVLGAGEGADAPAVGCEGPAEVLHGPIRRSRRELVTGGDDPDVERLAREPLAAVDRVEERVTEDARPPDVDERVAVARHPGLEAGLVGGSGRRFVMPQRGAAVVHEPPAGCAELEAQVDILRPVLVVAGEAADLAERVQLERAGTQPSTPADPRPRPAHGATGSPPRSDDAGQRDRMRDRRRRRHAATTGPHGRTRPRAPPRCLG